MWVQSQFITSRISKSGFEGHTSVANTTTRRERRRRVWKGTYQARAARHRGRRPGNTFREQRDQPAPKEEPATPSTNNSRPMKPLEHLYRWIEVLPNIPGSTTPRVYIRFHCRDLVPTLFQMTASHSLTEPELPVMDHLIVGRTKFEFQPSDSSLTSNFHHVSADSTVRFEDGVAR
jgi:hypothetical protein